MSWQTRLTGYCACFNKFPQSIDTHYCDAKCPALGLRRQLQDNKEPQKSVFTENLILTGAFSRKEVIAILIDLFKIKFYTASGKVDAARRNLRYNKYHVFKTDDGRLVAHKP